MLPLFLPIFKLMNVIQDIITALQSKLIIAFLLLSILIPIGFVQCQKESKIIGERYNASDPNYDIFEVNFKLLENNSLIINYVIRGSFMRETDYPYFYTIWLYTDQYSDFNNAFAIIEFFYWPPSLRFIMPYTGNPQDGHEIITQGEYSAYFRTAKTEKKLSFHTEGSTLTISGLNLRDIGSCTFYASADTSYIRVYNATHQEPITVDVEPRSSKGTIDDSLSYHEEITLCTPKQTPDSTLTKTETMISTSTSTETSTSNKLSESATTTENVSTPSITSYSKSPDYTPYYIIAVAVIVAGALIAFAIYRKK